MTTTPAKAARPPLPRKTTDDLEVSTIIQICNLLALLPPSARFRVLGYIGARVDSGTLPVVAAVGVGNAEDEPGPVLPLMAADGVA